MQEPNHTLSDSDDDNDFFPQNEEDISHPSKEKIKQLPDEKAEPNSLIFQAVKDKNVAAVEMLLEAKAHIELRDEQGQTLFFLAVKEKKHEILVGKSSCEKSASLINLLILKKADLGARSPSGETPLSVALQYGSPETVLSLLEAKAPPSNISQKAHSAALVDAITRNDIKLVQKMITAKASVSSTDRLSPHPGISASVTSGIKSTLHVVINNKNNPAMVELLLAHKAEIEFPYLFRTPLISAIARNQIDIVKILLANNADVNAIAGAGYQTALHLAAKNPDGWEMLSIVLDAKPNIHTLWTKATTNQGMHTPYGIAYERSQSRSPEERNTGLKMLELLREPMLRSKRTSLSLGLHDRAGYRSPLHQLAKRTHFDPNVLGPALKLAGIPIPTKRQPASVEGGSESSASSNQDPLSFVSKAWF